MADALAKLRRKTAWKRTMETYPTRRTCAGCDLCCSVLEIEALQKPAWRACPNLRPGGGGCGVWGDHPDACKNYVCLWRISDDLIPEDLFPASSGILVTMENLSTWPTSVFIHPPADRPDAWDTPRNRAVFAGLAASWNCSVVVVREGPDARVIFAPSGRVYTREEHPQVFVNGAIALPIEDFGPDRRPPEQRIPEQQFNWRRAAPEFAD